MIYYNKSSHTVFYRRFHIVWITKYCLKVLQGELRFKIRKIIAQASQELGVKIMTGVLLSDHVHLLVKVSSH